MNQYFTIESPSEGLYKEKGSKFLSFALPLIVEDDINSNLEVIRKQYHDARHHCYAWILGTENQKWRANDDGEPSHSAGDPILGQIRSFELTNILIVVVRYFGGTKLGVGGLINAYKTSAEEALRNSVKVEIVERCEVVFEFLYDQMSIVERLILEFEIRVKRREFLEACRIEGTIRKDQVSKFNSAIENLYNINIKLNSDEPHE